MSFDGMLTDYMSSEKGCTYTHFYRGGKTVGDSVRSRLIISQQTGVMNNTRFSACM